MAGCVTISRFVLVLLNLLLFVVGALLIVAGILTIYVPDTIVESDILTYSDDLRVIFDASYITIAAWVCVGLGVVVVIVAMCGCMGSAFASKVLLGIYIFVVIQLVLVQVGVGVLIYLSPEWFESSTQDQLDDYLALYPNDPYANPDDIDNEVLGWNVLQYAVGCCGINGPSDYENLTNQDAGFKYYQSCCRVQDRSEATFAFLDVPNRQSQDFNYTNEADCKRHFEQVTVPTLVVDDTYVEAVNNIGCIDELFTSLQTYAIAAIAVVAIQIFIIIIACIVCCASDNDEKPI